MFAVTKLRRAISALAPLARQSVARSRSPPFRKFLLAHEARHRVAIIPREPCGYPVASRRPPGQPARLQCDADAAPSVRRRARSTGRQRLDQILVLRVRAGVLRPHAVERDDQRSPGDQIFQEPGQRQITSDRRSPRVDPPRSNPTRKSSRPIWTSNTNR